MSVAGFITVFFTATVKFLIAPSVALGAFGSTVIESMLTTFAGGAFGITFFYLSANFLIEYSFKRKLAKEKRLEERGIEIKRKFHSRRKRKIIRIKNRFGLAGIAFVTPCIISVPIGSVIAARFYPNKRKALTALYTSAAFWAVTLTLLNDQVKKLMDYLF